MNPKISDLKIGIVFSGGFAKGAYEVEHLLEQLMLMVL